MKEKFNISGMTCAACVAHVQKAVESLEGTDNVNVNLLTNSMTLDLDTSRTVVADVIDAVERAGYGASAAGNEPTKSRKSNTIRENFDKETKALIPKGTLFDGGNDKNGKKRVYVSDFDIIVNKSQICQIKTLTTNLREDKSRVKDKNITSMTVQDNVLSDSTFHKAEIGFALSSPMFYLADGDRTIDIRLRNIDSSMLIEKYVDDIANRRKSLVSTGDRSAKIRTYNFPQGRVTDHRIGFTTHDMQGFLGGNIQEMIDALTVAENAEKLKETEL